MTNIQNAFTIIGTLPLKEYNAEGVRYEHKKTGCEIFHLSCEDEENLFAFIFPTPPADSAGLPHIIEHSVLSGSKHFPVKDPFAQLMQGSMNTFLNAMTYPDKTIYPASSLVENDFFNLLRVYADAVFFPLLKEEIFLQEGHHLHRREDGTITHSGVVYNEMKGNYSSAESIAGEWTARSLFEKSVYRFDSGGEPLEIGGLYYKDFLEFYRSHYHPTNGKIFLYGNIPAEKLLGFLEDEVLSHFDRGPAVLPVSSEPKWEQPRRLEVPVPASGRRDSAKEGMLFLNWLADPVTDPLHLLSMEVLSEILLGNQGAPLYQHIVESGIGEDVSPLSGAGTQLLQTVFTVGVRGTSPEKEREFEDLVLSRLSELWEKGIPEQVVEGSLNRVEFRNREIRGGIPFGLRLLVRSLRGWIHGLSPEKTMEFEYWFDMLRKRHAAETGYFENLLKQYLIANPHRSTVIITPDAGYAVEELPIDPGDSRTAERADRETEIFNRFQQTDDSPEDLAAIPILEREDIPREVEHIDTQTGEFAGGVRLYTHPLETNGIVYIDIGFPVDGLSEEEQFFLPLFSQIVYKIGCEGMSYDELSRTLFRDTGGLTTMMEGSTTPEGTKAYLFFRLKTLEPRFETGLSLLERVITSCDLSRTDKMRDVLLEMKNDIAASIIPRGNQYAMLAAARNFQPSLRIEEIWKGPEQLLFLDSIARMEKNDFEGIGDVFKGLTGKLFNSDEAVVQISAEPEYLDTAIKKAENSLGTLPSGSVPGNRLPAAFASRPRLPVSGAKPLRLAVPAAIGFAAAALRASWLGTKNNASESLLGHALRTGYLWEHVRMKGGAYGVSSGANGSEGLWTFTSYRDPQPAGTLNVFREALEFAAAGKIGQTVLEKAVIGTVGKEIHKLPPGTKGFVGFRRKLYGISEEMRQRKRDYILETGTKALASAAEELLYSLRYGETVLIADEKTLEKAGPLKSSPIVYLPV